MGFDTGQNLFSVNRLRNIVDRAAAERSYLVDRMIYRADEDHRNRPRGRIALQTLADPVAVDTRHPDVYQNQIRRRMPGELQPQFPFVRRVYHVAIFRQNGQEHLEACGFVINDEDTALVISVLESGHMALLESSLAVKTILPSFANLYGVAMVVSADRITSPHRAP